MRKETQIRLLEKVKAQLEGGGSAPQNPDDKPPAQDPAQQPPAEPPPPAPPADPPAEPAAPSPPSDEMRYLELVVDGRVERVDTYELTHTQEGRDRLTRALQKDKFHEQLVQRRDHDVARRAQQEANRRDVERGLLKVDPVTGQLVETDRARALREQPAPTPQPTGDFLTAEERTKVNELREEAMGGFPEKLTEADAIVNAAMQRNAAQSVDRRFAEYRQAEEQTRAATQQQERTNYTLKTVNAEIAKFPNLDTPQKQQAARNQVAAAMEQLGLSVVDQVALSQVAKFSKLLGGAPAPPPPPPPPSQPPAPPAQGHGSSIPPGPPPPEPGQQPPQQQPEGSSRKLMTSAMPKAVLARLRGA